MDVEEAYRILDLEVGDTQSEVKESWKLLAQIWHPDKHTNSSEKIKLKATLKYAELDQAYKFIQKNPSKKKSTPPPKKKKTSSAKEKDLLRPFWIKREKKDGSYVYELRTNTLSKLLEKKGFNIYKEGGEDNTGGAESYIQDVNGIIQEWDSKEVERVVKNCLDEPDLWKNTDEDELEEMLDVWADHRVASTKKALHNCEVIGNNFRIFRDRSDIAFITFTEYLVLITAKSIRVVKWKNLEDNKGQKVWKDQLLTPCVPSDVKDLSPSSLIKDNRKGDLDLKIIPEKEFIKLEADADKGSPKKWNSGDFLKWTRCLMTYPTKNTQGKILEWNLDTVRYGLLQKMAGYLLHTYKDRRNTKAVILMDSTGADSDKEEGGSGKSLFLTSLQFPRYLCKVDGKQMKTDSQFLFSNVEYGHQIIALDDIKSDFNFEVLFGAITTGLRVEKKNQNIVSIPFEDAPKFYICSNHALAPKNSTGGRSHSRRQSILEVSSFFTEEKRQGNGKVLINDMKERFNDRQFFSDDWNTREWNLYYNWMFRSVQRWLRDPHLPDIDEMEAMGITFENTKSKKLKQMGISPENQTWFKDIILNDFPNYKDFEIKKDDLWNQYLKDFDLNYTASAELKPKISWKEQFVTMCNELKMDLDKTKGRSSYTRGGTEYLRITNITAPKKKKK